MGDDAKPGFRWAKDLEDERRYCLHAPTRTVAKVVRFFDGVEQQYRSTVNEQPVRGPVLQMDDGNAFCADDESAFISLSDDEVEYYLMVQTAAGVAAKQCAEEGARRQICKRTALLLIGVALRQTATITDAVQVMT